MKTHIRYTARRKSLTIYKRSTTELVLNINSLMDLRRAVRLYPQSAPVRYSIADIMMNRGQLSEAMTIFDQLLNEVPDRPILLNSKGEVYSRLKQNKDALIYYNKATKVDKRYPTPYVNRAELYLSESKIKMAVKELKHATKYSSDDKRINSLLKL